MSDETEVSNEIQYECSCYPSRYYGYHCKNKNYVKINLYLSTMWNYAKKFSDDEDMLFDYFIKQFEFTLILERICLEVRFQKLRIKNRCKPCKMEKYAKEMFKESIS